MSVNRHPRRRPAAVLALLTAVAIGCGSTPPPPTTAPNASAAPTPSPDASGAGPTSAPTPAAVPTPTPRPTAPTKSVADLSLEMCDPHNLLPCEHQAAVLFEPIAGAGVALTYSTEWADGRVDRPSWNAAGLGLGGWSLNVLQRYDAAAGVLLGGDGSWRIAQAVDLDGGQHAVPTFDGRRYFVFDDAWRHVRTVDSVTGADILQFEYDEAGRLAGATGVIDGGPVDLTVDRGADGTISGMDGRDSTLTGIAVDTNGLINYVSAPDGSALSLDYASFGLPTQVRRTGLGATDFEYDDSGRLTKQTDADGVAYQLSYSGGEGVVEVSTTEPTGAMSTMRAEHDGPTVRYSFTDSDATVTTLELRGDASAVLNEPDGTVTTIGAFAHPRWGSAAPIMSPFVETRPGGATYTVETTTTMGTGSGEPAGVAWETEYVIDGDSYRQSFDPSSRTLTQIDPAGRTTTDTFDEMGRFTGHQSPDGLAASYAYDSRGYVTSRTMGSATTTYTYDLTAGEVTETRPDGTTATMAFDPWGTPLRLSADGENAMLTTDATGAVIQLQSGDHPTTSIGYSEANRLTAFIPVAVDQDASYETRAYSSAGQLASISGPGDRSIDVTYDSAGRATSWQFDRGTSTATYDATSGLLAANSTPDGVSTAFAYDGWVPVGLTWSGIVPGTVARTVDGFLRPTAESVNGADDLAFSYDAGGALTSIGTMTIERDASTGRAVRTVLGNVETAYEYDVDGRLSSASTTAAGKQLFATTYAYDALGRVASSQLTYSRGKPSTAKYTYDAAGRLATFDRDGQPSTYAYDEAGNRVLTTTADANVAATYDDRDRILTFGEASFEHEADGTLRTSRSPRGSTTYDFDDLGALRSVTTADGARIEYVLDAGGRRIGRKLDGALTDGYLYNVDDQIVAWLNGAGQVVARFGYDDVGRLALVIRDGKTYSVVTDQIGSPLAIVDSASGAVAGEIEYDAWGNIVKDNAPGLTPFGFAGGLMDEASGLVHFGARDYDPATGTWTSADPIRYAGGDLNLYRYAFGDPVNNVDPDGLRGTAGGARGGSSHGAGGGGGKGVSGGGNRGGGTKSGPYKDSGPGTSSGGGKKRPGGPDNNQSDVNDGDYIRPTAPGGGGRYGGGPVTSVCVILCLPQDDNGLLPPTGKAPGGTGCWGIGCVGGGNRGVCVGLCTTGNKGGDYGICIFGCVYGEPHLRTADGEHVDFQAAGEFIVAHAADNSFEVQARFEPPPSHTDITRGTALAIRVGVDKVAFYSDPARPLVVNGQVIDRADYSATLPGGALVERHGSRGAITAPDGTLIVADLYGRFINFGFSFSDAVGGSLTGLLGSHDSNPLNDLATRDGTTLSPQGPSFREQLYGAFAESWRVTQDESLFDYLPGETTETFQLREIPHAPATVENLDVAKRSEAEALCRAAGVTSEPMLSDCVLDFGLTGDPTYAGSAATVQASTEQSGAVAVDLGTAVEPGAAVNGQLAAGATDKYHFTAQAGDIVYIDAPETCDPAVDWRLMRPDGAVVGFERQCVDLGRRVLPEAGEWRIEVYSDESVAGAYSFQVMAVPPTPERTITAGEQVSGSITTPAEWHRYLFAATTDQVVYLDAQGSCDSPLSWRLLSPDGILRTFERTCVDIGRRILDVAGDWIIEIYADDLSTGSYSFQLIDAPATRVTPIAVGATVSDSTTRVGEWHRYTLQANAGDIVYMDALGACVPGLSWQLLAPDDTLRTFQQTCNDLGRVVLETAGAWSIEIYASDQSFGAYSFHVIGVPAVKHGSLTIGQPISDTIAAVGERHDWTLYRAGRRDRRHRYDR